MTRKKENSTPQVLIVSGLRDAGAMGELIDTMPRMDVSPRDLIQYLQEREQVDDLVTFVGLSKPARDLPIEPAVYVRMTVGYFRRLHKFINAHCKNNRRILMDEFVDWVKEQPVDQLINRMEKYMKSPVRTHRSAKKNAMYIKTPTDAYVYLYDLASMLASRFERKVSASDVFRGLVFNYINSVTC